MRYVPPALEKRWTTGQFFGDEGRPTVRLTIQRPQMALHRKQMTSTFSRKRPAPSGLESFSTSPTVDPRRTSRVNQVYADYLFRNARRPIELTNIKSVSWDRTVDTDAATCTIELFNVEQLAPGAISQQETLGQPGYFTYNYGSSDSISKRWKQWQNAFKGLLMPDNLIRVYEGYGVSEDVIPEKDPHLVQTGVWRIDTVQLTAQGGLSIQCRDLCSLLIDQQVFLGTVPNDFMPLSFKNWDEKVYIGDTEPTVQRLPMRPVYNSNVYWVPTRDTGGGGSPTLPYFGHRMSHAFDDDSSTYWLSIGNSAPTRGFSYEYVEGDVGGASVTEVRFRTKKKNYNAYVSIMVDGAWQGTKRIQWRSEGRGINNANIPFVSSRRVDTENEIIIKLPKEYKRVQRVRLTLGNLQYFNIPGATYHYHAAVRSFRAYGPQGGGAPIEQALKRGPAGSNPGRYYDYTDIVKLLCAWAGLYWPYGAYHLLSDGTTASVAFKKGDEACLGKGAGRVWGDFQLSGTSGPEEIGVETFDKKPFMDGISAIRDILGFVFFTDSTGGVVWRLPNIYEPGNWVGGNSPNSGRTGKTYTIDEKQSLMSLSATLSNASVREAIYVGNVQGNFGAVVPGFNPNPTGLRRVSGWTDQRFASEAECRVMADMIGVRQLFQYRTGETVIPGMPAIEIDDQVRIVERTTGERFLHYVKGVAMSYNADSGEYTYTLQHHWLGDRTYDRWAFNPNTLKPETRRYLRGVQGKNPIPISRRTVGLP